MKILLVCDQKIPVFKYGGTERIVWWLAKDLVQKGHQVSFLAGKGSYCNFGEIYQYNPRIELNKQIPQEIDCVHVHFPIKRPLSKPYIITLHGGSGSLAEHDRNTVFISKNHAERHGSDVFVYNGLDFNEYGAVDWEVTRKHFLFLGKASRSKKNLKGCIRIAKAIHEDLAVVGGNGWPFRKNVCYKGFLGDVQKNRVINQSKALLFPVIWHEPFGLAIVESLYFGCPVFGSMYGSLPELVHTEVGFLSNSYSELIDAAGKYQTYNRKRCHEYACDTFSVSKMTEGYLKMYEKVLNGESLNEEKPRHQLDKIIRHYPLNE